MNQAHEPFGPGERERLAERLLAYARPRRWFRAKSRMPKGARVLDLVPLDGDSVQTAPHVLAMVEITFDDGTDLYVIPLAHVDSPPAHGAPVQGMVVLVDGGMLVDALVTGSAAPALLGLIRDAGTRQGRAQTGGQLHGERYAAFTGVAGDEPLPAKALPGEQTNSTLLFGQRVLLKIYRQLTPGPNPELEVGRFLTEDCQPPCGPAVLGALSYTDAQGTSYSLGVAQQFLPNEGDAWSLTLRELESYLKRTSGCPPVENPGPATASGGAILLERALSPPNTAAAAAVGAFLDRATTLGRRTGELHLALASRPDRADFAPEPLSHDDRKALVLRASTMLADKLRALASARGRLLPADRTMADALSAPVGKERILSLLAEFGERELNMQKTRTHGDLHLGQVLARGDDFTIIDFEGEPARPLSERRAKSSPLRDVMGMVRSFDYAPAAVLRAGAPRDPSLEPWIALWRREVVAAYLRAYFATVGNAPFLPVGRDQRAVALTFYELEKVIYELGYELDNRPDWVGIPLQGLARVAGIEATR